MATLKQIDFDPFADSPAAAAGGKTDKASTPVEFAKVYGGAAKTAGDALGVDPTVIIGQWGLETGWGKSIIPGTNNLGNIKDMTGAGVGATDNMTGSKDKYRAYATPDDFAKDYVSLIQRKYPGAQNAGNDPAKFTAGLKGYAEDPRYPEKVAQASRMARTPESPIVRGLNAVAGAVLPSAQAAEPPRGAQLREVDYDPFAQTTPNAAPAAAPKRSMIEDLGRQLGLTVRAGVNGVAAIPAMAADAVTGPINAGLDAVAGKGEGFRFKSAGRSVNDLMTSAGLPQPENAQERVVQDAASAVAGAGGMIKVGMGLANYAKGPVTQAVGKMLSSGPGLQLASAATGAGSSGATREAGGGAGAQMVAGLAGGLAPGLAPAAAKASVRGLMRGGEKGRLAAESNMATFEAAGTSPTLGQVTNGRLAQATESLLAKTPGSAGVIAKRAQQQTDDMAASVQRLSDELAPGANATNAGEAIERGLTAFKEGTKQIQQRLYADLDKHIPAGTPIASERTRAALADLNTDIAGAPELSRWFKNARIQGIEGGLKSDTTSIEAVLSRPGMKQQITQMQGQLDAEAARATAVNAERRMLGMNNMEAVLTPTQIKGQIDGFLTKQIDSQLPYESIKKLRTLVGRELADSTFTSDVPRSKWSALYSALSDDLGVAAKNAGPDAEKSWSWANQFTRTQMERLDQLKGIMSKDTPEKIFNAATSGTTEGATTITRVINALPKQDRREVTAALLQRMGRATSGQQNAIGEAFSSETFLTNLSKFSPEARKTIFGRSSVKDLEARIGQLAKVAELRREGGKVFANPSGTAPVTAQMVMGASLGGAALSAMGGNFIPLAKVAAVPATAYGAARLMTSPAAARMAASKTPIRPGTSAAIVGAATRINDADQPPVESPREAQLKEVDFDPFAQDAPGVAPADAQQAAEPVGSTRIELNGMAPGSNLEPESAPQETGGEGDAIDPDATQGAAEADPAQAFTSETRQDGTLTIKGNPQALHATLIAAGIPARSIVRNAAGVMVGRSQAGRVQEAIARMGQHAPEDAAAGGAPAEMTAENQPMPAAPAGQADPGLAGPQMAGADLAPPAGEMAPGQGQFAAADPAPGDMPAVPALETEQNQAFAQLEPAQSAMENVAPEVEQTAQAAQAEPVAEPVHPMVARIQRLKDAGEDQVASVLQRNHDREQTLGSVQTELAGLLEAAPDLPHHQNASFQSAYQQQRVAGAKPAEAAARAGILAAVQETAPGIGMPEKAVAALQAKLDKMPVDDAPGFVQRFTQALISKGVLPAFEGVDQIEQMLTRARDGSMNAMVDSAYRQAG